MGKSKTEGTSITHNVSIFQFYVERCLYFCHLIHCLTNKNKMKKFIEWVEIPTADFQRGLNFYNSVFKLSMEPIDSGTEQMACFPTGEGAIFYKEGYLPSDQGSMISFTVPDSIEETALRVEALGGKVLIPKTPIDEEGRGYFAVCIDSEGNKIGLYEKF